VIKKIFGALLFLLISQCLLSPPSAAQNADPCNVTTSWWFTDPLPPGWFSYKPYPGAFVFLIAAHLASCSPGPQCNCPPPPPSSPGSGPGPGPSSPTTPVSSLPVYLTSGNTYIEGTDLSLPGLGGGLSLRRQWISPWPAGEALLSVGIFGPIWRSTFEEKVFMSADNWLRYARGDGSFWAFGYSHGAWIVASPAPASATLSQTATNWLITFQSGEKRLFSLTTGQLTAIIDRNGNTTQIAYDSSNRVATVTDPASRHLYFNYGNTSWPNVVSSVTSDFGVTLSYSYDTSGRLVQITRPDLTTINYTYNAQSQITQVTDSNGKVLESHTYDSSGRGLTASQANGVNAVTYSYPQ